MKRYEEEKIGRVIDHIQARCAKSSLDSPSINITREGWDMIVDGLQRLNSYVDLVQHMEDFAAQIEKLTGRDPRLPNRINETPSVDVKHADP